jgi:hypothetical protein
MTALGVGVRSRQGILPEPFQARRISFFDFVPMHPLEESKPTFVKVQQR